MCFDTKCAATEMAKWVAAGRPGSVDETVDAFVVDVWLHSKEGPGRLLVPLIGGVPGRARHLWRFGTFRAVRQVVVAER